MFTEGGQGHHALIAEEVADLEDQGHTDQGLGKQICCLYAIGQIFLLSLLAVSET